MKAEDLRLGNYVELEGLICKLNRTTLSAILQGRYNELKPIPISEKILLNCGFETIENNWKVLDCFYLKLSWERLAGFWLTFENESIYLSHIKHLHQLQNIFFSLTNEELTINL